MAELTTKHNTHLSPPPSFHGNPDLYIKCDNFDSWIKGLKKGGIGRQLGNSLRWYIFKENGAIYGIDDYESFRSQISRKDAIKTYRSVAGIKSFTGYILKSSMTPELTWLK